MLKKLVKDILYAPPTLIELMHLAGKIHLAAATTAILRIRIQERRGRTAPLPAWRGRLSGEAGR